MPVADRHLDPRRADLPSTYWKAVGGSGRYADLRGSGTVTNLTGASEPERRARVEALVDFDALPPAAQFTRLVATRVRGGGGRSAPFSDTSTGPSTRNSTRAL